MPVAITVGSSLRQCLLWGSNCGFVPHGLSITPQGIGRVTGLQGVRLGITQDAFLYLCPDCPSCLAHLNNIDWATWTIWAAIMKYTLLFNVYRFVSWKSLAK